MFLTAAFLSIYISSFTRADSAESIEINDQQNVSCGAKLVGGEARCQSIRYYYSALWMMFLCSEEGESDKQPCPRSINEKMCEASGSSSGPSCVFEAQIMPYSHLRITKLGQGDEAKFAYNWGTHGFKWEYRWSITSVFLINTITPTNHAVPAVETDDAPLTMSECGRLAVRVINKNTGNPITPDWNRSLPFPCKNESDKFGFVYSVALDGETNTSVTDDAGTPVFIEVRIAVSFVNVKYTDGEELCFAEGGSASAENCENAHIQLQKTAWWKNGYEKGIEDAPKRANKPYLGRSFETHITADHSRPDSVADPHARCQGASYLYGVLGAELVCNGSCADAATGECTNQAIYDVCQDGWRSQKQCDLRIKTETLPNLARKDTKTVPWNLPNDRNPGIYINEHSQKQYVYLVDEPDIISLGVEDTECFSLRVKIYDHDEGGKALSAVKILRPPVPSSCSDPLLLVPMAPKDASISSNPTECVSQYGRWPDGFAWLKIHFFILPLYVKTKQGFGLCWQPGSPLKDYVKCDGGNVELDSASPQWWSEVKDLAEKNFPKKKPSKTCFGTQLNGRDTLSGFSCK